MTVYGGGPKLGFLLRIVGWLVVKFMYGASDVIIHGNVDTLYFIVPFDFEATLELAIPIYRWRLSVFLRH